MSVIVAQTMDAEKSIIDREQYYRIRRAAIDAMALEYPKLGREGLEHIIEVVGTALDAGSSTTLAD